MEAAFTRSPLPLTEHRGLYHIYRLHRLPCHRGMGTSRAKAADTAIFSGESGLVKKPGQGRLDAFQCAWAVSPAARASYGNAELDGQVMEFDRQVMGKNRECVRFCFIVFCFITVPEAAKTGLRRIRGGLQLPNASRHAPRRLSRLLRCEISSRGGTAPRDGVREHVRGVLPGRRRRAPTLKDNLHVSARSVLTGRRTPPPASTSFNTVIVPVCLFATVRELTEILLPNLHSVAKIEPFRQISGHAVLEFNTRVPSVSHTPRHLRPRSVLTVRARDRPS